MPNCGCGAQTCSCRIIAGENITITGSGSARDPWQISAAGGGEGSTGFRSGDRKETYRTDTEAGWLEENGQAVSRTTYADLFAAIGTRFGSGDGTNTFNVPNAAGRTTVGVGPGYPQDQTAGSATTTLTAAMLPPHTHTMAHTHSIAHDHASFWTDVDQGAHSHAGDLRVKNKGLPNHTHNAPDHGGTTSGNGATNRGDTLARADDEGALSTAPLEWTNGGEHRHSINVPAYSGDSGGPSAENTGSVGSGQAFNNLPPYRAVRALIKT